MIKQNGAKTVPRIAVVSPGLLPVPPVVGGSVETVIQKMVETTGKNYDVSIYGPTHRDFPAVEKRNNLGYYRFPSKDYKKYFKLVRKHITGEQFELIQVENRPLFVPRTKAANPQSKFILSLHSLIHTKPKLISPGLTSAIFLQCDKVLVYSKFMRDQISRMFPEAAEKLHFIHLATEPDRFIPRWDPKAAKKTKKIRKTLNIPKDGKIILFAGRVIPTKGVHVLIASMEKILRKNPNCYLVVVGSGWFGSKRTSPYIKQLRSQSRGIASNIRFTNYVRPADLPYYFALADVFVCPSQWEEPFGLVNVEAMASGVPVVASACGGIPEIITDGVDGFLVKDHSAPEAFVKPMLRLLKAPGLARNLGINGRRKVEEYFNWDRAGKELNQFYGQLLGSKRKN